MDHVLECQGWIMIVSILDEFMIYYTFKNIELVVMLFVSLILRPTVNCYILAFAYLLHNFEESEIFLYPYLYQKRENHR